VKGLSIIWKPIHPNEILSRSSQVDKIDVVGRRTFGLDVPPSGSRAVDLSLLTGGGAVVQINQQREGQ